MPQKIQMDKIEETLIIPKSDQDFEIAADEEIQPFSNNNTSSECIAENISRTTIKKYYYSQTHRSSTVTETPVKKPSININDKPISSSIKKPTATTSHETQPARLQLIPKQLLPKQFIPNQSTPKPHWVKRMADKHRLWGGGKTNVDDDDEKEEEEDHVRLHTPLLNYWVRNTGSLIRAEEGVHAYVAAYCKW
jgi:hypothetical protein